MRRAGVLLLMLLAACGGSSSGTVALPPAPTPSPSVSPSVSPSPSPSPEVVRYPATKEGAKAIARAFFVEAGRADLTGDTTVFRQLVEPTCHCVSVATTIEAQQARGERHEGKGISVTGVKVGKVLPHAASMLVTFDLAPATFIDAQGARTRKDGERGAVTVVSLVAEADHWLVSATKLIVDGTAT